MTFCRGVRFGLVALWLGAALACSSGPGGNKPPTTVPVTPETHQWFPIVAGTGHAIGRVMSDGAMACESCHLATSESFKDFTCLSCHAHEQALTDKLHAEQPEYSWTSDGRGLHPQGCYSCHPDGTRQKFHHVGISSDCASCHDSAAPFAAIPGPGQLPDGGVHPAMGANDCGACHSPSTVASPNTTWRDVGAAPTDLKADPAAAVTVNAGIPTWSGTSISSVSPQTELLPMPMSHSSSQVPAAANSSCTNCHNGTTYYPGTLHESLNNLQLAQPAACRDCHATSVPHGFVGPTATSPVRNPASAEMKHDAVLWASGAPGSSPAVPQECGVCHRLVFRQGASWADGLVGADGGVAPARFHASLSSANLPQPGSCLDCHANSRPSMPAVVTLASGLQFDHSSPSAMGDCQTCHGASAPQFTSWAGGQYHAAGSANPTSCLPCHAGERPTTTTGWSSTTYTVSPFDYVTNVNMIKHGDGLDCAGCHVGPGTGAWGSSPNWVNGHFGHEPTSVANDTCIACHVTQRPNFAIAYDGGSMDHQVNGMGDCYGCHQATVVANTYVKYAPIPGSDWKDGKSYPGDVLAKSDRSISVTELKLIRSGTNNLVTNITPTSKTYYNGMKHTSAAVPAAISPGPASNPDETSCAKCHLHDAMGVVTSYSNGVFHDSLTALSIAQPTQCLDCHAQMRPHDIVERDGGFELVPMDHAALFTAAVTIQGASATGVGSVDCSFCHNKPGDTWADGVYHAKISAVGGVPADCNVCHYPLMATTAPPKADLTSTTKQLSGGFDFAMKHRSGQITFQNCKTCHTNALANATMTPAAALWLGGKYHSALIGAQPATCVDCHTISVPTPAVATQSLVAYNFTTGSTTSNKGQWMNHASTYVAGKDCALCHLADARQTNSAWSLGEPGAAQFHAKVPTGITTCQGCHGLTNGKGTVAGTNNNLPVGLTDSTMVSSAVSSPNTGLSAGTLDQINHADVNVTGYDCNFCHTQAGTSTAAGVQGKEWAVAKFHVNFTTATPLVLNGSTGRCSTCHMNVRPGSAYAAQDHSGFTAVSGSQDCSSCHSWPGTGSTTAPNWKGAQSSPQYIVVGGFNISVPPAPNASTVQAGLTNLPHPAVASGQACTACHTMASGGKQAFGYDHALAPATGCAACHEAGSNLVGSPYVLNAPGAVSLKATCGQGSGNIPDRAGDTRPINSVVSCTASASTHTCGSTNCRANHFYPADCAECHAKPANGLDLTKTGQPYVTGWKFPHTESKMQQTTCCMCHPGTVGNCKG